MLSKKMAFSLMSLITLLALAFVVPSAMAVDDFDAEFSVVNKVYDTDIEVTVSFKEEVPLALVQEAEITVYVEDMNGVRTAIAVPATGDSSGSAGAGSTSENWVRRTPILLRPLWKLTEKPLCLLLMKRALIWMTEKFMCSYQQVLHVSLLSN